jgi:hypothetical protein
MKKLRFLHITKTGGQSIAKAALKHNIKWGVNDQKYTNDHWNYKNNLWNVHSLLSNIENAKHFDWFTVVRNPYERLVSEYNFFHTAANPYDPVNGRKKNAIFIAGYDQPQIEKYKNLEVNDFIQCEIALINQNRLIKKFRFLQQSEYFEDGFKIHVIKFENLEEEFNKLMLLYGYEITLDEKINVSIKKASIKDLTPETIELINKTYKEDFIRFNYEML